MAKISETGGILGCINEHDGTGFIHALLQSYHPGYSRMKSDQYRTNLAKSVRIGALPAVLRARYGSDPLCKEGCSEARAVFGQAVSYGSPLPPLLMKHYAEYLGTPYRLYDSNFQLIEEYEVPEHASVPCNIITTDEDEYHLVVRLAASKRGDKEGTVRFKILDESLVPE